jgi:DNA invertase Pin-like site-specific DNA recombinase
MHKVQRVGYVRVSSGDQNVERQLDGVDLDKVFTDKASGKDTNRPQLAAALEYLREGDTLLVHSMDRLARNAEDLLRIVRELVARGVSVSFVKNLLSFSGNDDPMGKLMLTMLAAFGEFERELIRERQREGIAIAKAKGVYRGRKRALTPDQIIEVTQLALNGMPKAEVARTYGISRETLYQYLRGPPT